MREIWLMQPRFEKRVGSAPFGLVEQARFRAAFDFMRLRAETGEIDEVLADWWEEFSLADDNLRHDMVDGVRQELQRSKPARSPRPRKASSDEAAPASDDAANAEVAADDPLGEGTSAPKKRRRRRRKPAAGRSEGGAGTPDQPL